jgi:glucose/arabinose dehydrogenase
MTADAHLSHSIDLMRISSTFLLAGSFAFSSAHAAQQADFYKREEIPLPPGEVMEVSSIALMPNQQVAVATRRGDIWICTGAYGDDLSKVTWSRFARDLHEPLGMSYQNGSFTLTQRPEVTRITDSDKDGQADTFETICSDWGIKGDYHEYAFGSSPDKNGDIWVALCLTGSFTADSNWRGWAMRVTPEGKMIPTCSGVRSPGGLGFNAQGDVFMTDNQGPWNGASSVKWLKPGSFQGNPSGNKFHTLANLPAPPEPESKSRILTERLKHPEFIPPAVQFPHGIVGQSPTGIACDQTGGKFGPWPEQLFVGEQTHSQVQRVNLEKVNGLYQGAVFHFLEGFEAGLIPVVLDQTNGTLFVGGSNRGWGSRGSKPFTFERVKWTGTTPFEIQTITVNPDGFTLKFTEPTDPATAGNPASYAMDTFTYIYQSDYGSPQVDATTAKVTVATVSPDGKSVRLKIDGIVRGHIHHLEAKGVKSAAGNPLWHQEGWYTLNEIPK